MADTVKYRFVLRRGLAADWVAKNEILLQGEFGLELDTDKLKIGDGTTAWNDLDYFAGGTEAGGDRFAIAGGTADALTATFTPPVTSLTDGMQFEIRAAFPNTAPDPTLAIEALGPYVITREGGKVLKSGDIAGTGHELVLRFNAIASRFELVNPRYAVDVTAGSNIVVDDSDPHSPRISSTAMGIGLKGRVPGYSSLPSSGNASGDAYVNDSDQSIYVWDGAAWPASGDGIKVSTAPPSVAPKSANFGVVGSNFAVADKDGRMLITSSTAAASVRGLRQASVAHPYTLDISYSLSGTPSASGGVYAGIFLSDGSKFRTFMHGMSAGGFPFWYVESFTTSTSGEATVGSGYSLCTNSMAYLRITDDGSIRTYLLSNNGLDYAKVYSESSTTFISNVSYFGILSYANGAGAYALSVYNWRISNTVLSNDA